MFFMALYVPWRYFSLPFYDLGLVIEDNAKQTTHMATDR
jgi:hypothetical protein